MTKQLTTRHRRHRSARARLMRDGCRDILPMTVGYFPMAFAIGGVIAASGVGRLAGWSGGPLIAAGSAQLALIDVMSAGGGLFAAVAAAVVINARLVAYSAGLAPWLADESRRWKLLVGCLTIDVTYLLAAARFKRDDPGPEGRRWYFVGMGLTLYPSWALGMAAGVIAGGSVPAGLALEGAATFMMVGLLALALDTAMIRCAAIAGGGVGLASGIVPGQWTPLIAAAVAIAVASLGEFSPALETDGEASGTIGQGGEPS